MLLSVKILRQISKLIGQKFNHFEGHICPIYRPSAHGMVGAALAAPTFVAKEEHI